MKLPALLLSLMLTATPATAGYRLVEAGKPAAVAKSSLTVTPDAAWNRATARPGRHAETWTFDGIPLNDLTFYGGVEDNRTLFKEVNKRERPLPRFSATMLPTDVPQLFENSYRIALGTPAFTLEQVEPATFAGRPGFRFRYSFVLQGEEVKRNGEATGAIIAGRLYLVTFEAPTLHYFDRDLPRARAVVASARL